MKRRIENICVIVLPFLILPFILTACQKNTDQKGKIDTNTQSIHQEEEKSEDIKKENSSENKTKESAENNAEQPAENEIVVYTKNENRVHIGDSFEVEEIEYCVSEVEISKNTFNTSYESTSYFTNQLDSEGQLPKDKTLILLTISAKNVSSKTQDVNFNKGFCILTEDNRVIECISEGCVISKSQPGHRPEDFFVYTLMPNEKADVQVGYLVSDEDLGPELYYCIGYLGSQADLDINRFVGLEIP